MQYAPKYKLILLLHDFNCTSEDKNQNIMTESVCMLSCFSCARLFAALWTIARQAPPSMGFSRQEYWSGLPCPPPGDLPKPWTEHMSPVLAGRFFITSPRKP